MQLPSLSLFLIAALAVAGGLAHAEKADRDKVMNIEADALRYDDARQISVFTGRVVLTKGTIVIRGAKVDVRQDAQGYQFGRVLAAPDKPAFFRQKREGLDEYIEGEGEVIEYDSRADTVKFTGKAQLRRYRGATLSDEFTGALIQYNNLTDVFSIDGAPASSTATTGRVRAMLTPKPEAVAPTATPLVPALRATTTLGKEAK